MLIYRNRHGDDIFIQSVAVGKLIVFIVYLLVDLGFCLVHCVGQGLLVVVGVLCCLYCFAVRLVVVLVDCSIISGAYHAFALSLGDLGSRSLCSRDLPVSSGGYLCFYGFFYLCCHIFFKSSIDSFLNLVSGFVISTFTVYSGNICHFACFNSFYGCFISLF